MALSAAFLRDITENIRLAARQAADRSLGRLCAGGTGNAVPRDARQRNEAGAGGRRDRHAGRCCRASGSSLLHAARALFERHYGGVCLLNADSPTLPTANLVQAAQALAAPGDRVVLGPAEDGGYYLIGMKAEHAAMFADIAWSTDTVAAQTRERVASLGLDLVELETWYDVDDNAALRRLLSELAGTDPGAYRRTGHGRVSAATGTGRTAGRSGRMIGGAHPHPALSRIRERVSLLPLPHAREGDGWRCGQKAPSPACGRGQGEGGLRS